MEDFKKDLDKKFSLLFQLFCMQYRVYELEQTQKTKEVMFKLLLNQWLSVQKAVESREADIKPSLSDEMWALLSDETKDPQELEAIWKAFYSSFQKSNQESDV